MINPGFLTAGLGGGEGGSLRGAVGGGSPGLGSPIDWEALIGDMGLDELKAGGGGGGGLGGLGGLLGMLGGKGMQGIAPLLLAALSGVSFQGNDFQFSGQNMQKQMMQQQLMQMLMAPRTLRRANAPSGVQTQSIGANNAPPPLGGAAQARVGGQNDFMKMLQPGPRMA